MTQPAKIGSGNHNPVGDGDWTVGSGECIISIAEETGQSWQTLWDHPQNSKLKQARGVPNVLLPGDKVFVPPIRTKTQDCETDKLHRFILKSTPLEFVIRVYKEDRPQANEQYILNVEGRVTTGNIPSDGTIRCPLLPTDQSGTLLIGSNDDLDQYNLSFGTLDPVQSPSGLAARLRNLGLLGSVDDDDHLAEALSRFQLENDLPVSGKLDHTTADRLVDVHGS
jgi:N-acetylmuramoyl-L-alanine amidase